MSEKMSAAGEAVRRRIQEVKQLSLETGLPETVIIGLYEDEEEKTGLPLLERLAGMFATAGLVATVISKELHAIAGALELEDESED